MAAGTQRWASQRPVAQEKQRDRNVPARAAKTARPLTEVAIQRQPWLLPALSPEPKRSYSRRFEFGSSNTASTSDFVTVIR